MRLAFRWSMGACLVAVLIAGTASAWPVWGARVGLSLTAWLDAQQQVAEERHREEILDRTTERVLRRLQAKSRVLADLRDHRLTLLEAAARFRDLGGPVAGGYLEWSRQHDPGQTDEERWCRQVILFLRGQRAELASLADHYEAELAGHLARGSLWLPVNESHDVCGERGPWRCWAEMGARH